MNPPLSPRIRDCRNHEKTVCTLGQRHKVTLLWTNGDVYGRNCEKRSRSSDDASSHKYTKHLIVKCWMFVILRLKTWLMIQERKRWHWYVFRIGEGGGPWLLTPWSTRAWNQGHFYCHESVEPRTLLLSRERGTKDTSTVTRAWDQGHCYRRRVLGGTKFREFRPTCFGAWSSASTECNELLCRRDLSRAFSRSSCS